MSLEYKIIFLWKAHNMEPATIAMLLDTQIRVISVKPPLEFVCRVLAVEHEQHKQLGGDMFVDQPADDKQFLRPRMILRDMHSVRMNQHSYNLNLKYKKLA